jgi:hypothetical protein
LIWIKQPGNETRYQVFQIERGIPMRQQRVCASLTVILGLLGAPALAHKQEHEHEHEQHPAGMSLAATAAPSAGMPQGMRGDMPMMGAMRVMMGQGGMSDMSMMAAMAEHVEGRLAYLKTELRISEAQLPLWNAVADAIRANAKGMGAASEGTMGSTQASTLPDKLALREKMITAHLEALRKFEEAVAPPTRRLATSRRKWPTSS